MQTESKLSEVEREVIDFMQSFIDMSNLLEENVLRIVRCDSVENSYFIKKSYSRYGRKNTFPYAFMFFKFSDDQFKVTFNLQIDDDRNVANRVCSIKNNYGEQWKTRNDHGLVGGWSYDFIFKFNQIDLFKKLMSEVI